MQKYPWEEIDELEVELDESFDKLIGIAVVVLTVSVCSAFVFGAFLMVRGLM